MTFPNIQTALIKTGPDDYQLQLDGEIIAMVRGRCRAESVFDFLIKQAEVEGADVLA